LPWFTIPTLAILRSCNFATAQN